MSSQYSRTVLLLVLIYAMMRIQADVAELADALGLGPSAARREGSSPFIRSCKEYINCYTRLY